MKKSYYKRLIIKNYFFDNHSPKKKNEKNYLKFCYRITSSKKKIINSKFIIYTSGTTNKAKGVLISTKAISNNVFGINKNLEIKSKDRGIIFSPQLMLWACHKF